MGTAKKAANTGKTAAKKAPATKTAASKKEPAAKKPAAAKAPKAAKGAAKEPKADAKERKMGLRGAAPWAARHAEKHAAEARARAMVPPPPGSARLTIRVPEGAEDIKVKVLHLHNTVSTIKAQRKNFNKTFFDIGTALLEIRDKRSFEAKGFATFEAFTERELPELGKTTCLRLVKVVQLFQREAALQLGIDKLFMAITAIETEVLPADRASGKLPPAPASTSALPLRPPGR